MKTTTNGKASQELVDVENMRQEVIKLELSTRSYIAMRDKMQATIDIHHLQDEYDRVLFENNKKMEEKREEYKKKMEEAMLQQGLTQEAQA